MDAPGIRYATTGDGVEIAYLMVGSGPPLVSLDAFSSPGGSIKGSMVRPRRASTPTLPRSIVSCFSIGVARACRDHLKPIISTDLLQTFAALSTPLVSPGLTF